MHTVKIEVNQCICVDVYTGIFMVYWYFLQYTSILMVFWFAGIKFFAG